MNICKIQLVVIAFALASCSSEDHSKPLVKSDSLIGNSVALAQVQKAPDSAEPTNLDSPSIQELHPAAKKNIPRVDLTPRTSSIVDVNISAVPNIQELNIPEQILNEHPDTLKVIALGTYMGYKSMFPVSIADNFEEGISTEHIHYPRIVFSFTVYENEFARKPHTNRNVTVWENEAGSIVAE